MHKVPNISDEELIDLIHQGNAKAADMFFKRYYHYSWRLAYDFDREHPDSGISIEDYHQIAFASTAMALKKFLNNNDNFYGYWKSCASNDVMDYFLNNSYTAKGYTFNGLSIDYENDNTILAEEMGFIDPGITEQIIRQEFEMIKESILTRFDKKNDRKIINLFLDDKSIEEIEAISGEKTRHIYYTINRFQNYVDKEMKKRNYK